MFSIARVSFKPALLARAFAAPGAAASLHTLPELPYAYNVRVLAYYVSTLSGLTGILHRLSSPISLRKS